MIQPLLSQAAPETRPVERDCVRTGGCVSMAAGTLIAVSVQKHLQAQTAVLVRRYGTLALLLKVT